MNKTPNADSKNEVIDGMAPGLKLCVNKSKNVKLSDTVENSDLITLSALKKKRNKKCLLTTPDCSSVANPSIGETTKKRKTITVPKTKCAVTM